MKDKEGPGSATNHPPPPVPDRPWASRGQGIFPGEQRYGSPLQGSYGSGQYPYGSFGLGGTGGGGLYGYGGGGPGYYGVYGGVRGQWDGLPALASLAEEHSRPAFETILSVVHGFNSVGAMLESIYLALHSCLRAVIGVVEAAARAKAQMTNFISAFAAIRSANGGIFF